MRTLSLLLVLAVAAVGCGSDDDQPAKPSGASPSGSQETTPTPSDGAVAIEGFKFVPEDVTVDAGTKVTWTNEDAAPHTASADDGSFDTGDLRQGDTGSFTFRKAGSYAYFCEFHRFMRATVTVR